MDRARILVVEDEELVGLAIKRCLEGFGYEVPCVVASGEDAVEKSASLEADLVLMDIRLQGAMSGIDAAALIRDSTRVPVVYLTAYSDADTLEKAKLTEPYGFVLKPFEEPALEATVKMALSRSRSQRELQGTHDRLAAILHSVGDAVIMTELNGTILYANARARQLLQLPSPLPPFSQLFPRLRLTRTASGEPIPLRLEEVVLERRSVTLPGCTLALPDGSSCAVDVHLEPYRGAGGIVFVLRDASERDRIRGFLEKEMADAARTHRSLLPPDNAEMGGVRTSSFLLPAGFAAGDLYNVVPIDPEHAAFYLIDVAGHGLAAASTALLLQRLLLPRPPGGKLPFLGASPLSPSEVVTRLNTLFYDERSQMFFTICYGVIDVKAGRLRLVRAGHPYPVLLRHDGKMLDIRAGGNAVGLSRSLAVEDHETEIGPGDRLVLFSDGLSECANARGEQFSRARMLGLLALTREAPITEAMARIRAEVVAWRASDTFDDDVSLLALELPPA